jgi:cytosine/adenosine deaminase-related metal-dependent hydrolase
VLLAFKARYFRSLAHTTRREVALAGKAAKIVCCPRSNAALTNGFPPLREILESGGALGTDNVMVNSPDMFREMEFAYKTLVGSTKKPFYDVRSVLKAATLNARQLLHLKPLSVGGDADFVLLNLEKLRPFWNQHSTVVNSAQTENVEVVVGGGVVAKSILRKEG